MVRDAFQFLIPLAAAAGTCLWLGWLAPGVVVLLLAAFVAFFFRDPQRRVPPDAAIIVAPADGKVVRIEPVPGGTRVSIFLSLFNVHVNRSPIAGRIEAMEYRRGRFKAAFEHSASVENEQNAITVNGEVRVTFSQIAGVIARRIVCWKKVGDVVEKGERIGLIRFGSRVDIVFPPDSRVTVALWDAVHGGSSPIGMIQH